MATASLIDPLTGDVKKEMDPSGRHSPDLDRPFMCELRVVLLGRSGEEKSKVGNIILGGDVFSVKDHCERVQSWVNGKRVVLINTPDLLDPQLPDRKLFQQIESCVNLSTPGPHALLLVLQKGRFTQDDRKRLQRILSLFSDEAFKYSLVLVTQGRKRTFLDPIGKVVEMCNGRCHTFSNTDEIDRTQVSELMEKIEQMLKENEGDILIFKKPDSALGAVEGSLMETEMKMEWKQKPQVLPRRQQEMEGEKGSQRRVVMKSVGVPDVAGGDRLNLVLFGRRGAGKTSVGNAILGQRESSVDPSSSSVCERREGEVCGRLVSMVEMPADVTLETHYCASLCVPGVHAFLLVTPAALLTDEDKTEIIRIQEIFGSRVTDYLMILFTQQYPTAPPVFAFLQHNKDNRELLKIYAKRFCVFNNQDIVNNRNVPSLLKAVEEMNKARESCFSLGMYLDAQLEKKTHELEARHRTDLQEKERKIRELKQCIKGMSLSIKTKDQSSDCLRILLVGKTGSGKSATGNTILQREEFLSEPSSESVMTCCKKGVGKVAGRPVAVVDTSGLFDAPCLNEELQQEIAKCITFLAPGPHVFLLVLQIGRITKEEKETLQLIQSTFDKKVGMFTIVMFTGGDHLNEPIERYIQRCDPAIQNLIHDCGDRIHVFNNKDKSNRTQVFELLDKIDMMVRKNGGGCYTNEVFQEAEMTIKKECERILRQKKEEMQRENEMLEAKHKEEMEVIMRRMEEQRLKVEEERTHWEKELKELKEEHLGKELDEWKKRQQVEKERRDEEEKKERQEIEWKRKIDEIEEEKKKIKEKLEQRDEEEKQRKDREEKEMRQLIEKQRIEKKEFEKRQEENKKKREVEEQERKLCEERERMEWEQKIKDVQKEKKEIQEVVKKKAEELEQQREMERKSKEEMEMRWKQKEEQERREWDEKQKKMRDKFEKEREQERQRREKEWRHKEEMMERDLEEKRRLLKKQQDEWDKERNEGRERRYKEDEQRREEERKRLTKLQEEFDRVQEEENQKRKKEDQARKEREEKEQKAIEEEYERKFDEMRRRNEEYKEDARKQAEEFNDFKMKSKRSCVIF